MTANVLKKEIRCFILGKGNLKRVKGKGHGGSHHASEELAEEAFEVALVVDVFF